MLEMRAVALEMRNITCRINSLHTKRGAHTHRTPSAQRPPPTRSTRDGRCALVTDGCQIKTNTGKLSKRSIASFARPSLQSARPVDGGL